jgi:hypothetical protein
MEFMNASSKYKDPLSLIWIRVASNASRALPIDQTDQSKPQCPKKCVFPGSHLKGMTILKKRIDIIRHRATISTEVKTMNRFSCKILSL